MSQKSFDRRSALRLGGGIIAATSLAAVVSRPAPAEAATGTTYQVWRGSDGDEGIWWNALQSSGSGWTTPQPVPGAFSSSGVALAVDGQGQPFMTWKGANSDEQIWWNQQINGTWTPQQPVSGANTSVSPALLGNGLNFVMAWKGADGDQAIWSNIFFTTGSNGWTAPQIIAGANTSFGPALALRQVQGNLYMAWKGVDGDQRIWWSQSSIGTPDSWTNPQVFPGSTSAGVALSGTPNGNLLMAWKGAEGDDRIWWSQSFLTSPAAWTTAQVVPGANTTTGPALAVNGGTTYMTWRGDVGDEEVWWNSFNGSSWTTPQVMPGANTSFRPALSGFPFLYIRVPPSAAPGTVGWRNGR